MNNQQKPQNNQTKPTQQLCLFLSNPSIMETQEGSNQKLGSLGPLVDSFVLVNSINQRKSLPLQSQTGTNKTLHLRFNALALVFVANPYLD